jgi:pyridoxine 4-dehydrogenase
VHPIAAVEVELSLWSTDILHNNVARTCAELKIPIIAYSPLGRGALTGSVTKFSDIPEGDIRRRMPKFQDTALEQNIKFISQVSELAERKKVTVGEIALAWIRTLSCKPGFPTIIPIPGGTTSDKVIQNTRGIQNLSDEDMAEIEKIQKGITIVGDRY